jgi:predicted Zn-dependent protease
MPGVLPYFHQFEKNNDLHVQIAAMPIALIMALLLCLPAPCFSITIQEEEELAEEMMKSIDRYVTFIEDDAINAYVDRIGREVLAAFPRQHFNYHFYVIEEPVYNAFATPAGHIFINSGLIGAMESEEELAGIIAHEIAHVHGRHISQKIERSKKAAIALFGRHGRQHSHRQQRDRRMPPVRPASAPWPPASPSP